VKVGVFSANLDFHYQHSISEGLDDGFHGSGISVLYFIGESLDSPRLLDQQSNFLYDLAREYDLDGLIGITGSIGVFADIDFISRFYESFQDKIPTVSIGMEVPGVPSIVADNSHGIQSVMEHLIHHHKKKNIAYLGGPEKHQEAISRFEGYQQALKEAELPYNEDLVVSGGQFIEASGEQAILELLQREVTFDAVVAANDSMAFGAVNQLKSRGYRIPEDIAICGFDNTDESRTFEPKLTTVAQSSYLMGYTAAVNMYNWLTSGFIPAPKKRISTDLFIRHSCGCQGERDFLLQNAFLLEDSHQEVRKTIVDYWHNTIDLSLSSNTLIDQTIAFIEPGQSRNDLIQGLARLEKTLVAYWKDHVFAHNIYGLTHLLSEILNTYQNYHISSLMPVLQEMEGRLSRVNSDLLTRKMRSGQQALTNLWYISSELLSSFDYLSLSQVLSNRLQSMKIEEFYLVKFNPCEEEQGLPVWSRLIFAHRDGQSWTYGMEGSRFPTNRLLPQPFLEERGEEPLLFLSLFHQQNRFGYVVYRKDSRTPVNSIVALTQQLRSAINGIEFVREKEEFSSELERQVAQRTKELKSVNQQLLHEIQRKEELQLLMLNIADRERKRFGQELHDDICQRMGGISMLAQVLKASLDQQDNPLAANAETISRLIDETLDITRKVSRGLFPVVLTESGLKYGLEELCQNREAQFSIPIKAALDTRIPWKSLTDRENLNLYRIAQEALQNALRHSGADRIVIRVDWKDKGLLLSINDNGKGISRDRMPSSGIGMRSMENRAETIGAKLEVESRQGKGTSIMCTLEKEWGDE